MATTINTSDDLLKLLAENTEFYQAVRRLILSDELIELPERFARFTAEVHDFIIRQERFNAEQHQFNERIETAIARIEVSIGELKGNTARIEVSIGELKGNTARFVVDAQIDDIAEQLEFTFKDTLSRQQLRQLIRQHGHTDEDKRNRQSFIHADLVMIAEDAGGDTHYIAVEASYTGDARDTTLARRNAEMLQRFTGCPAHAMVASVRNDQDIQAEVDGGEVHWYALDPDAFRPD